jgi:hypothetical protein
MKIPLASLALCHDPTLENIRPVLLTEAEYVSGQRNGRTQYAPRSSPKVACDGRNFDVELAATLAELESEKDTVANDPQKLQVLFREMTQMCLW